MAISTSTAVEQGASEQRTEETRGQTSAETAGDEMRPSEATPAPDRSTGVQELSRLLLQGWTMMAETCPRENCHMPLARSRQGRVVCCSCGLDVVLAPRQPALPPPSDKPEEEHESSHEENLPNGDVSNAVVPARPRAVQGREAVSAALGEKLLQGWTMLDAVCEHCAIPLLRDNGGRVVCVGCQGGGSAEREREGEEGQLMPRVMDVARGDGERRGVVRGGEVAGGVVRGGEARAAHAVNGGRSQAEERREVRGRGFVREGSVDVDEELRLGEVEAARTIRRLRQRLPGVEDAEEARMIGVAMTEMSYAIKAAREARHAGAGRRLL